MLCKLGIHTDTEKVVENKAKIVEAAGRSWLVGALGFTEGEHREWHPFRSDGLKAQKWKHPSLKITIYSSDISRLLPSETVMRVCLKCGKTSTNYNLLKVYKKLMSKLDREIKEQTRQERAKAIAAGITPN